MLKVGYKTRAVITRCPGHSANQAVLTMLQSKHVGIIVGSCPIQQARVKNSKQILTLRTAMLFVPTFVPKHLFDEFK